MKKIVAVPLSDQKDPSYQKLFGVSLQELQEQGLSDKGVPAVVRRIVGYLTQHGEPSRGLLLVVFVALCIEAVCFCVTVSYCVNKLL
jgi:hypothetical protein